MRVLDNSCTFKYPWAAVTCANWKKYPNEITTHVESVDVLRREVDPVTGVLRSERLITCRQSAPAWISAVIGGDGFSYVREVSEVDPKAQTLVMRSQNLTFNEVLKVFETVKYTKSSKNPKETEFYQEACISAQFGKLCNRLEDFCADRFMQNAKLGRSAFELVLQRLTSRGAPA